MQRLSCGMQPSLAAAPAAALLPAAPARPPLPCPPFLLARASHSRRRRRRQRRQRQPCLAFKCPWMLCVQPPTLRPRQTICPSWWSSPSRVAWTCCQGARASCGGAWAQPRQGPRLAQLGRPRGCFFKRGLPCRPSWLRGWGQGGWGLPRPALRWAWGWGWLGRGAAASAATPQRQARARLGGRGRGESQQQQQDAIFYSFLCCAIFSTSVEERGWATKSLLTTHPTPYRHERPQRYGHPTAASAAGEWKPPQPQPLPSPHQLQLRALAQSLLARPPQLPPPFCSDAGAVHHACSPAALSDWPASLAMSPCTLWVLWRGVGCWPPQRARAHSDACPSHPPLPGAALVGLRWGGQTQCQQLPAPLGWQFPRPPTPPTLGYPALPQRHSTLPTLQTFHTLLALAPCAPRLLQSMGSP